MALVDPDMFKREPTAVSLRNKVWMRYSCHLNAAGIVASYIHGDKIIDIYAETTTSKGFSKKKYAKLRMTIRVGKDEAYTELGGPVRASEGRALNALQAMARKLGQSL